MRLPITTRVVLFLLVACCQMAIPTPLEAGGPSLSRIRAARWRAEKQVADVQRRLKTAHGADCWYVFRISQLRPTVTHSVTRVTDGIWYRDFASARVATNLETTSIMVQGEQSAAGIIWKAVHASIPTQFEYHTFRDEDQANNFHCMIRSTH